MHSDILQTSNLYLIYIFIKRGRLPRLIKKKRIKRRYVKERTIRKLGLVKSHYLSNYEPVKTRPLMAQLCVCNQDGGLQFVL